MRVLVDTHVFLWWLQDSPRLSQRARAVMQKGDTQLLWSTVSSWEVAVKLGRRRLRLPSTAAFYLPERLAEQGLECLPVENAHALRVADLPPHHRDPFDRLLIAQAQIEEVPILSDDQQLLPYGVQLIW